LKLKSSLHMSIGFYYKDKIFSSSVNLKLKKIL